MVRMFSGKIVYASGKYTHYFIRGKLVKYYDVIMELGNNLADASRREDEIDEEYWRARIITGMTQQKDPFFHRKEYLSNNYGKR